MLTSKGDVEMDAVIMDGKTLKSGAVACVHNIKNPIVLAREVMEKVYALPLFQETHHGFARSVFRLGLCPLHDCPTATTHRSYSCVRGKEQNKDSV